MSSDFNGKVIAITGGASGIGLALSKLLYSAGAKISICDINESNISAAVSKITDGNPNSSSILATVVDVRSGSAVDAWIEKTVSQLGTLDGAANLAGVMGRGLGRTSVDTIDDEDWNFVLDVNLTGTMNCLRAEIRAMKKAGKPASVVNTASIAGLTGFKNNSAYVASKHAVVGLTRSVAKEVGNIGIRVNAVAPYVLSLTVDSLPKLTCTYSVDRSTRQWSQIITPE
jgi:NAD(P)-dependent dehydrogenase (short-subunit alcohol dehydrogenase family)